jgi:hypothetical protein
MSAALRMLRIEAHCIKRGSVHAWKALSNIAMPVADSTRG